MAEVAKNIKLLYSHIHTLPHTHTHTHTHIYNKLHFEQEN